MSSDAGSPLTFAVGDIHGCLDKLNRLIAACEVRAAGRPARYVFVGDYIDRGPQSRDVIDIVADKDVARRAAGGAGLARRDQPVELVEAAVDIADRESQG